MISVIVILILTGAMFSFLLAGIFFGRGKGPMVLAEQKIKNKKLEDELKELNTQVLQKEKLNAIQKEKLEKDTDNEVEIDLLKRELEQKLKDIEGKQSQISELSTRVLELERKKTGQLAVVSDKVESDESSQEIREGFEGFVDALQRESDTLREELENAHMAMNRMEKELSRLLSGNKCDDDREELLSRIDFLNERLQEYALKIAKYEYTLGEKVFPSSANKKENTESKIKHSEKTLPLYGADSADSGARTTEIPVLEVSDVDIDAVESKPLDLSDEVSAEKKE
ncbi:MAG: hypothetical protein JXR95_09600 [Deltaproteobacteria bacterium]|nr:hypothetical protein [Deltaproteobacteria bacterium]